MVETANPVEREAPPEALVRARLALREQARCIWMRKPGVPVQFRSDVELVVRRLRQNGGPAAWQAAVEIEACL